LDERYPRGVSADSREMKLYSSQTRVWKRTLDQERKRSTEYEINNLRGLQISRQSLEAASGFEWNFPGSFNVITSLSFNNADHPPTSGRDAAAKNAHSHPEKAWFLRKVHRWKIWILAHDHFRFKFSRERPLGWTFESIMIDCDIPQSNWIQRPIGNEE
jgi:hypothetical protein